MDEKTTLFCFCLEVEKLSKHFLNGSLNGNGQKNAVCKTPLLWSRFLWTLAGSYDKDRSEMRSARKLSFSWLN